MKNKKIIKVSINILIFLLLITCLISNSVKNNNLKANSWNSIDIAVDENFTDANLFTATKISKSSCYIWTCLYDRLLNMEDYGELSYSLAESITILPNPNNIRIPVLGNIVNGISPILSGTEIPGCVGYNPDVFDVELNSDDFDNYLGDYIVEIKLKSGISYHNGESFDANCLYNYIQQAKSVTGTLIFEQWKAITRQYVLDSETIIWILNFSDLNYGFMDFKYSLTRPIASIGYLDEANYIGTGAYFLEDNSQENVLSLVKNQNWWNSNFSETNIDMLNFIYNQIDDTNYTNYDICVVSSENSCYDYIYGIENYIVSNNPVVMRFNNNSSYFNSNSNISNFQRLTCFGQYLENENTISKLMFETSDYWCYENKMNNSISEEDESSIHDFFNGLNILVERNSDLVNIANCLALLYCDENHIINVVEEEPGTYIDMYRRGIYDIALQEIELENIDSSIAYLNGWLTNNQNLLRALKQANNPLAFQLIQIKIHLNVLYENRVYNMGWTNKKIVINNSSIENFTAPLNYAPYGNAARIDFRTLIVNANR